MTDTTDGKSGDAVRAAFASARDPPDRDRILYSFAIDGKKLPFVAAVSRVKRDSRHQLDGYQRAESWNTSRRSVAISSRADAVLPNALVVAFDSRVRFEPTSDESDDGTLIGRHSGSSRRSRIRRRRSPAGSSTASSEELRSGRRTSPASRSM